MKVNFRNAKSSSLPCCHKKIDFESLNTSNVMVQVHWYDAFQIWLSDHPALRHNKAPAISFGIVCPMNHTIDAYTQKKHCISFRDIR